MTNSDKIYDKKENKLLLLNLYMESGYIGNNSIVFALIELNNEIINFYGDGLFSDGVKI